MQSFIVCRVIWFLIAVDPTLNAGDNSHSILSPSSAPSVICVGATGYRTSFLNYLGEKKVYNNGEHGQRTPFQVQDQPLMVGLSLM